MMLQRIYFTFILIFLPFALFAETVLVTGASGFVGSNLCRKLWRDGHDVIGVDNFQTSHKDNLSFFKNQERFQLIQQDVSKPLVITDKKIDWIFNLASAASPRHYQKDPIHTWKTNILGAMNLLELAKAHDAVILQASTSEVYGDPLMHPQKENYWGNVNPIGIRSCYDESKRAAESLFMDYHRVHQTKIKIVRIFNTYGPGMSPTDGRVVSNFINQALESKPITVYGKGHQTRSFCYVDDLVAGLVAMIKSDYSVTGPINIGNPKEITIVALADLIQTLTGKSLILDHKPLPADDPVRRNPDISLAMKHLEWSPQVSLEDGLSKTIEYFNSLQG